MFRNFFWENGWIHAACNDWLGGSARMSGERLLIAKIAKIKTAKHAENNNC